MSKTVVELTPEYLESFSEENPSFIQEQIDTYKEKFGKNLMNIPDKTGATLTHYLVNFNAASALRYHRYHRIKIITENEADFSIKDNDGNTPLHKLIEIGDTRQAHQVFQEIVKCAAKQHFNFNTLNEDGLSVLHIAAFIKYEYSIDSSKHLKWIIDAAKKYDCPLDVDHETKDGATALGIAMRHKRFDEIEWLLNAGSNPHAEKGILEVLQEYIRFNTLAIGFLERYHQQGTDAFSLKELTENAEEYTALNEAIDEHIYNAPYRSTDEIISRIQSNLQQELDDKLFPLVEKMHKYATNQTLLGRCRYALFEDYKAEISTDDAGKKTITWNSADAQEEKFKADITDSNTDHVISRP